MIRGACADEAQWEARIGFNCRQSFVNLEFAQDNPLGKENRSPGLIIPDYPVPTPASYRARLDQPPRIDSGVLSRSKKKVGKDKFLVPPSSLYTSLQHIYPPIFFNHGYREEGGLAACSPGQDWRWPEQCPNQGRELLSVSCAGAESACAFEGLC
jgi:hypothetical protein